MAAIRDGVFGAALAGVVAAALFGTAVAAQSMGGQTNAVQGFSQNRNEPIKIESDSLEIRDKERIALFNDNVKVVQGDTMLECKQLVVHYDGGAATPRPAGGARQPAPSNSGGSQNISRLEAKGGVVVTQKGQTAVGDTGIYDTKTNSMTLIGNVVVTQGPNVVRGDRLSVDLATGFSRVESTSGRVQTVIIPGSAPGAATPPARAADNRPGSAATPPAPPSRPSNGGERNRRPPNAPLRVN